MCKDNLMGYIPGIFLYQNEEGVRLGRLIAPIQNLVGVLNDETTNCFISGTISKGI
jgi:hypothetical protein